MAELSLIQKIKLTTFVRVFAFAKIPLLWWVRPTVIEMSEQKTILKIPLSRRTQNHMNAMYFGALAMGAEASVALRAVFEIHESKQKVDFLFKDFQANFLKRAEGDVLFICEEGPGVRALLAEAIRTGERMTQSFNAYAVVPSVDPNVKVAEFKISLSLKKRK